MVYEMSEKYVAEYVEIIDGHGERKGVCVTDTEHTVSFEVKDEYVAMELCDLLNQLYQENEHLIIGNKNLMKKNEQLKEELNNLKKDETMLYHYYTLARYGGDGV